MGLCLVASAWLYLAAVGAVADRVAFDCGVRISREGTNVIVSWQSTLEDGQEVLLHSSSSMGGPWTTLTNAAPPLAVQIDAGDSRFFRAALTMPAGSAEAPEIAHLVRDFVLSSKPELNPTTEFDVRVVPIEGLWATLQAQVVDVQCLSDGQQFNRFACVLRKGEVKTLGLSFGGHGLMSGLTRSGSLYYSYSWGSGMHRSHVGMVRIVNEGLKFWDSSGFPNVDLFLSRRAGGGIAVVSGKFEGFNRWLEPAEYGRIDETDPSATKLVGSDGSVLATLLPIDPAP